MSRSSGGVSRSRRSMRAISTVSIPQRVADCAASVILPKLARRRAPAARRWSLRTRARRSAPRRCAVRAAPQTQAAARSAGSNSRSVAMPGTVRARKRPQRLHRLDDAGGSDEMAECPLEAGDRRRARAEHLHHRGGFGCIRLACPVRVRDDHADVRRPQTARRRARRELHRPARRRPRGWRAGPARRGAAAAQDLAERPSRRGRQPTPRSRAPEQRRLRRTSCRHAVRRRIGSYSCASRPTR